nr:hypothetical protein [uncultured Draconibacterium sp.]
MILFSLLSINCLSQNRQFELWNKNQISIEPWEKISIDVSEKLHFSPQRLTITLRYADIFFGYQAFSWLEYGAGFRISSVKREAGDWLQENRPMVFANFGKDLGHYEFDFYNRFEYRTHLARFYSGLTAFENNFSNHMTKRFDDYCFIANKKALRISERLLFCRDDRI